MRGNVPQMRGRMQGLTTLVAPLSGTARPFARAQGAGLSVLANLSGNPEPSIAQGRPKLLVEERQSKRLRRDSFESARASGPVTPLGSFYR